MRRHVPLTHREAGREPVRNDLLVAIAQGYGMNQLGKLGKDSDNGRPLTEILR